VILHIARDRQWSDGQAHGEYRGDTLDVEGFIHCSTGRQVRTPWRALFAQERGLVLLLVDESRLGVPVRYESAHPGEDAFPHVYGPIPTAAVTAAEPIPTGAVDLPALPPPLARLVAAARGDSPVGIDEWRHQGYTVSTDRRRLDVGAVHSYVAGESYWAAGVPRDVLERAIDRSLTFGLHAPGDEPAGFARVVTDTATFAYLCDVFVTRAHRGRGLGVWLVRCAVEHPELAGVRSWLLGTRDAHGLYERFGWAAADSQRWMWRGVASEELFHPQ
jgi:uncharacterized protein (DUF952 family)/GNAT superfamily N-acetyltransferase